MRLGYDATTLTMRRTGIGRYTLELLRGLVECAPEIEIELLSHRPISRDIKLPASVRRRRGAGLPLKIPWMQLMLPLGLRSRPPDVCHFTNYHAPLLSPVPFVVTLHDMSLVLFPEHHPRRRVMTMRPFIRRVARRASAVICLTEAAKHDAVRVLDLDPADVWVVPGAPAKGFRPVDDQAALAGVAGRYGLEPGFILFVGTIEPRKNLARLVEAYARLRRDGAAARLVICGGRGWGSDDLPATVERLGLSDAVKFIGFVPDEDVVALMNLAGVFVYPSLYEGFGLPVIEAFACGTPVVTSDRGAMVEVAGDAALLCDPDDVESIATALATALTDEPTRANLRRRGLDRAVDFSWQKAAQQTADVYRAVVERG